MSVAPALLTGSATLALLACGSVASENAASANQAAAGELGQPAAEAAFAAAPASWQPKDIHAQMGPGVARIEFDGELHNGTRETGTGSGFVIAGNGLILTCKHVVPVLSNYKNVVLQVRLGKLTNPAHPANVVWTAAKDDLVLLRVPVPTPRTIAIDASPPTPGEDVTVLGFPLNLDLNINRGIVSGPGPNGRYVMDAAINAGNSGGPVFTSNGKAIGVAWGAALNWTIGDQTVPVEAVKFFIPFSAVINALPPNLSSGFKSTTYSSSIKLPPEGDPVEINRAETVEFLKDDHPVVLASHSKRFEEVLRADEGYRIVGAKVSPISVNHASPLHVAISDDGETATASSELTSGPAVDRWRGWLVATVQLTQRRRD